MENTHAKTHSGYTVEIAQLFRASRSVEADRFQQVCNGILSLSVPYTLFWFLIWHCETIIFLGSFQVRRTGCYSGMGHVSLTGPVFYPKVTCFSFSRSVYCFLLFLGDFNGMVKWTTMRHQPGLRIAPPEAPVTGYMFGKGVYFADMFSKSANYCYANSGANDGVLLLCEVYSLLLNCSFHMENNKTLISYQHDLYVNKFPLSFLMIKTSLGCFGRHEWTPIFRL